MIKKCINCGKEKEHEARGLCYYCYKKIFWKSKVIVCKRCGRKMPLHAKGLCGGCYNFVFHLDRTKEANNKKRHNLDIELYRKITLQCFICGFDKVVDLHHLDENRKNNDEKNLIGLCPNHHKMLHDFRFRKEMRDLLSAKGINLPKDEKIDFKI